ncbi:hypothetical protein HN371_10955 [Candidatus Poribacteria bacterium]|jgi:hypothetical protein|nr:hypothetical protein [Candidatus Poribacteria bacterium]MBT5531994.1 hypothetical protein [Candidatus Poribacteria bacterium]MBT5711071.1 hypothetical protein [Candidatus Poribacteria bacterium]MBT7097469.1 hypothetical protein [Candidatus Poribacteria bacterium]MBT7808623.1 hypothetical protein [Candidatus Poribacteria bacterium]
MFFTCRETRSRVDGYSARALNPPEQLAVRAHLNACDACRSEVAKAERISRAVRHAMTVVPPPGYMDSLPARLARQAESLPGSRWGKPARLAGLAAAAALLVFIGQAVWTGAPSDSETAHAVAPTSAGESRPTVAKASQALEPRTRQSAAKREDLMQVQLVAAEPREIAGAQVSLSPVAMAASEAPMHESWRIDQLIAAILRPRREAARSREESFGDGLYASGEEAVALARQATYDNRRSGYGGLSAFVAGSVSAIADVTLPLY